MIESIEGKRGMPRLRPPYVAQVGLFGYPTLEHNMETVYWVREIVEKGAQWFASQGRNGTQGPALVLGLGPREEARRAPRARPGITVKRADRRNICGGMLDGHAFYGYLPGRRLGWDPARVVWATSRSTSTRCSRMGCFHRFCGGRHSFRQATRPRLPRRT